MTVDIEQLAREAIEVPKKGDKEKNAQPALPGVSR